MDNIRIITLSELMQHYLKAKEAYLYYEKVPESKSWNKPLLLSSLKGDSEMFREALIRRLEQEKL